MHFGTANQEEKEKRKAGKGAWHMKDCKTGFFPLTLAWICDYLCCAIAEKRKLLVKARYDALAAEGGKRAVRKAIEKKQKKIGQKEKKSRPFRFETSTLQKAVV
jgi:ribosomal RNA-processing protein 36